MIETICILAGPAISLVVSALKRVDFIGAYPKTTAFILSTITAAATTYWSESATALEIIQCTLVPFAGAIATYEAGTRQVLKLTNKDAV